MARGQQSGGGGDGGGGGGSGGVRAGADQSVGESGAGPGFGPGSGLGVGSRGRRQEEAGADAQVGRECADGACGAYARALAGSDAGADAGADTDTDTDAGIAVGAEGRVHDGPAPRGVAVWQERAGLALRERMPVWLQTRCGLERRSVLALTVLLAAAAVFAVQHFWVGRTQTVRAPEAVRAAAPYDMGRRNSATVPPGATGPPGPGGTAGAEIVVDVSGKVRKPGIHRLPAGSRVVDALVAAGGVRPGVDTDGLNRARFLVDGEQVVVGGPAPVGGAVAGSGAAVGGTGSGGAGPGGGPAAPVSLNTATVDQLDTLPGVGPVLAQHIVDYRAQHRGFRSVDELREVNGIGARRFADLRNLVRP
ncbi:helix-hairpin-helix domain-containing protein [Streptomyces humidus]|uniref:helix-hairpin-helix domain-containing protein n=1 Tax=Streptomyces humidus TaxID=52259 RepID=UPI003570B5E6